MSSLSIRFLTGVRTFLCLFATTLLLAPGVQAQREGEIFIGNPSIVGGPSISTADAIRFLEQCTFGPTKADIARVQKIGYSAFLDEQFAAPLSNYNYTITTPSSLSGMRLRFFQNALRNPDQLRQRVAFALSQVLVVNGDDKVFPNEMRIGATFSYQTP